MISALDKAARAAGLTVLGGLHDCNETILLIGPDEPAFWSIFTASPEYHDDGKDPLDRWSKRVIGGVAAQFQAKAVFPSDGPPYPPFIQWALASGRCWVSPAHLLVHDTAGLFASFRGALKLSGRHEMPAPPSNSPCDDCTAPCTTACPVDAFASGGYDVAACKVHIETSAGSGCYSGCLVRRACPISQAYGRLPEQSEFHMKAFHPND
jgi:epoxyqueuosine reductase